MLRLLRALLASVLVLLGGGALFVSSLFVQTGSDLSKRDNWIAFALLTGLIALATLLALIGVWVWSFASDAKREAIRRHPFWRKLI